MGRSAARESQLLKEKSERQNEIEIIAIVDHVVAETETLR